jgi:hypothetical protein
MPLINTIDRFHWPGGILNHSWSGFSLPKKMLRRKTEEENTYTVELHGRAEIHREILFDYWK